METFLHPTAQKVFVNIDGVALSASEWRRIRTEGMGINVLTLEGGADSLAPLTPQADWITHLLINSGTVVNLALLEQMPNLVWLGVGGLVRGTVDVTRSTKLAFFGGPVESFPGVVDMPSLRDLRFDWSPTRIGAPIERLFILDAAKLTSLPELTEPAALRELLVYGSARLDLSGLSEFVGLASLTLNRCRRITAADRIVDLPVDVVVFEDCPDVDPIPPLAGLRVGRVEVRGKNPFTAEFRATVGPNWTFPPGRKYLPS